MADSKYWILSLDGGGVRCIIELVLLRRIFERFPHLEKKIKLVAGTSAGAIVAACFAVKGFAATYSLMMNKTFMERIFSSSYSHDALTMNGWRCAMFANTALLSIFNEQFGSDNLSTIPKSATQPDLLVPAFCVDRAYYREENECILKERKEKREMERRNSYIDDDNEILDDPIPMMENVPPNEWCPRVYHSLEANRGHAATKIADILTQTTAAPTYFPVYQGCVDGGVVANCPAMLAVTTAFEFKKFSARHEGILYTISTAKSSTN